MVPFPIPLIHIRNNMYTLDAMYFFTRWKKRIQTRWLDTTLPAKRKKTTGKRKYKHPTNDTKACLVIFDHFRRRRRRQTSCSPKEREREKR